MPMSNIYGSDDGWWRDFLKVLFYYMWKLFITRRRPRLISENIARKKAHGKILLSSFFALAEMNDGP